VQIGDILGRGLGQLARTGGNGRSGFGSGRAGQRRQQSTVALLT
jgi:hypothetical protein